MLFSGCLTNNKKSQPVLENKAGNKLTSCDEYSTLWLREWSRDDIELSDEILNPLPYTDLNLNEKDIVDAAISDGKYTTCGESKYIISIGKKGRGESPDVA
jgi:hypothetical protein